MKGIYRKRFSSGDLKHLWERDGQVVDLALTPEDGMFMATFSDGHKVILFSDEVDVVD